MGVGTAQAAAHKAEQLGHLGVIGLAVVDKIAQEEEQRATDLAATTADNAITNWTTQRLLDPKTGALTVRGKDVLELPGQVLADYDKFTGTLDEGLTDKQKLAVAKVKLQHQASIYQTVQRHAAGEWQKYEAQEVETLVTNKIAAGIQAAQDPHRVQEFLGAAVEAVVAAAPRQGLGKEALEAKVDAITTTMHAGVVNELLARQLTTEAQVYFEAAKGEIKSKEVTADLEKALLIGSKTADELKAFDAIVAAGGTRTQQIEAAKKVRPELRDGVTNRLRVEHARLEHEKDLREQDDVGQVYALIDAFKRVDGIVPPALLARVERFMPQIRAFEKASNDPTPTVTDWPTYYTLEQQSVGDAREQAAFLKQNLLLYKHKLGDAQFQKLSDMQAAMKSGNAKQLATLQDGIRSNNQIITDTLGQFGYVTSGAGMTQRDIDAVQRTRRRVDELVEDFQSGGKKAGNKDVQAIVDNVVSQGMRFNTTTGTEDVRFIDLQLKDVPARDRQQIDNFLRATGRTVSDVSILDEYIKRQFKRRAKERADAAAAQKKPK